MKIFILSFIFVPLYVFLPRWAPSWREMEAQVVKVLDGDTIIVQKGQQKLRLRLIFIDAPELKQVTKKGHKVGELARAFLLKKIYLQTVKVRLYKQGRYKRWLAEIYKEDHSINLQMVAHGLSFLYPFSRYPNKHKKLTFSYAQQNAREKRLGVWGMGRVLRPWSYRKRKRKNISLGNKRKANVYNKLHNSFNLEKDFL